jgi:hypothetical protein
MKTAIGVLAGWLLAALLLLAHDGRLPEYLAGAISGSLLILGVGSLLHQQRAPSRYNQPALPERYLIADDLRQPIAAVVAVAQAEASHRQQEPPEDDPGLRLRSAQQTSAVDTRAVAVEPSSSRCRMTRVRKPGTAP